MSPAHSSASLAESWAENFFGPNYDVVFSIADAIKDGKRLPMLDDLKLVKSLMEENLSVAVNRDAEIRANKIIQVWKEASGKDVLKGPFTPTKTNEYSDVALSLLTKITESQESDVDNDLSGLFGGSSTNNKFGNFFSSQSVDASSRLDELKKKREEAPTEYERNELDKKIEEVSKELEDTSKKDLKNAVDPKDSFNLCAKIVALGEDSPLSEYYSYIVKNMLID